MPDDLFQYSLFKGELGVNAFTAAYSQYGKYKILIWGLLQFNLGYELAVVATGSKEHFKNREVVEQYVRSIVSGSQCTMDFLHWPTDQKRHDLRQPIAEVRKRYHIDPVA